LEKAPGATIEDLFARAESEKYAPPGESNYTFEQLVALAALVVDGGRGIVVPGNDEFLAGSEIVRDLGQVDVQRLVDELDRIIAAAPAMADAWFDPSSAAAWLTSVTSLRLELAGMSSSGE
jgi:hypothetical protein